MPFARLSHGQILLGAFLQIFTQIFSAHLQLSHRQVTALNFDLVVGVTRRKHQQQLRPMAHEISWDVKQLWTPLHLSGPQHSVQKLNCSSHASSQTVRRLSLNFDSSPAHYCGAAARRRGEWGRRSDTKFNLCSATSGAKRRRQWG